MCKWWLKAHRNTTGVQCIRLSSLQAHKHACIHTHKQTQKHNNYSHTNKHKHTDTYTHKHIHTQTHTLQQKHQKTNILKLWRFFSAKQRHDREHKDTWGQEQKAKRTWEIYKRWNRKVRKKLQRKRKTFLCEISRNSSEKCEVKTS